MSGGDNMQDMGWGDTAAAKAAARRVADMRKATLAALEDMAREGLECAEELKRRREIEELADACLKLIDEEPEGEQAGQDCYDQRWLLRAQRVADEWAAKHGVRMEPCEVLDKLGVPIWSQRNQRKRAWAEVRREREDRAHASVVSRNVEMLSQAVEQNPDERGIGFAAFARRQIAAGLECIRVVLGKARDVVIGDDNLSDRGLFKGGEAGAGDLKVHNGSPAAGEEAIPTEEAGHRLSEAAK